MARIIERTELEASDIGYEFQGVLFGDKNISFIIVEAQPGDGVKLHLHPYDEIFIVLEGTATYTVGDKTFEAHAGQTLIGPADVPHMFINTGTGILKQVDIHESPTFSTTWL